MRKRAGRDQRGFTLVEILASVIVLIAVGSIISGILSSSLRGANKTNLTEDIRQNGNYALNQISKNIESALPFDGENTGLSNDDGETYDPSCSGSLEPSPIPETLYNLIAVQSVDNVITRYRCTSSELSANGVPLIDVTDAALISLKSCSFKCIQDKPTDVPIIRISFGIGSKNSNNLVENSGPPIMFETSVAMKNYKR